MAFSSTSIYQQALEVQISFVVGGRPVFSMASRFAPLLSILIFGAVGLSSAPATEIDTGQSVETALADARRALEIAQIEQRLYLEVEYPKKQRCLDAQIELLSAEIDALKEQIREYEKFHRSRYSRPFLTSLQECKLALLDAELGLKDARADRSSLRRFHSDRMRLYELKVGSARARVVALDQIQYGL
ncbi:MAG: DUF4200 domain-containing protein [Pirellulales bacterium]|nr:DUF4200 domain-containing protein [Pirellulales bacterium]